MSKQTEKKAKRRPGREHIETAGEAVHHPEVNAADADIKVVDVETGETSGGTQTSFEEPAITENFSSNHHSDPKIEIKFAGSELIRAKFPKPFEVAEIIATDWLNNGRFEGLPLGHPLAQYFAAKGLRKAKEVEKKVLESPVTEKIAMQALTAGMKAQEFITQVRSKVKKP